MPPKVNILVLRPVFEERLNNTGKYAFSLSGPAIDLQKLPILAKKKIIFSNEARLDLGGHVNKQNCRFCGTVNLHAYIENPTHPKRVTVWCGFWSRGIIGPFFFENEQGDAVTVNGHRFRAMLNDFLFTKIKEEDIGNIWFSTEKRYMPFSRSYTRCFACCF